MQSLVFLTYFFKSYRRKTFWGSPVDPSPLGKGRVKNSMEISFALKVNWLFWENRMIILKVVKSIHWILTKFSIQLNKKTCSEFSEWALTMTSIVKTQLNTDTYHNATVTTSIWKIIKKIMVLIQLSPSIHIRSLRGVQFISMISTT